MRIIGNILWYFPFLGFINALFAFLFGSLLVLTVVAAPIGLGLMQYAKFLLAPFSWSMVNKEDLKVEQNRLWEAYGFLVSLLWLPIGLICVLVTVAQIVGLLISIVGIPVALVLAKSLGTFIRPVGKVCVPVAVAHEILDRRDRDAVGRYMD